MFLSYKKNVPYKYEQIDNIDLLGFDLTEFLLWDTATLCIFAYIRESTSLIQLRN